MADAPLTGKTILITRAAGQSSQFAQLLQQQGATVMELPALEIYPPSSWAALDGAIAQLHTFQWLILTSVNAVDYFLERLIAQGKTPENLTALKIAVVGQKTAARLIQRGITPNFIPPSFVADSLVESFPDRRRLSQMKILFPRVETGGREVLVKEFTECGAEVVEVAAYQSDCAQAIAPEVLAALTHGKVEVVTFASSKTVKCFAQMVKTARSDWQLPEAIALASIGPQTSATCQELFGRVDIEASEYTLEGLTQAIVNWASQRG
ncbi:MAG: uroporphyrinogen-III synthase [Drouetiella hepatica Uher 2000/2452]|jgi:uroporphyrinogen-III synthase|uniref:Uroporphyrinogen-III synthase n=1 Tax=Drouetiella hepatica Uher 2000/2452 TaxID=904376 RepID=A0A951QCH2_9CYAN|nr:uroporphyrinogen-III synthase [Drouetiella hepatica Uher 2000/2452]